MDDGKPWVGQLGKTMDTATGKQAARAIGGSCIARQRMLSARLVGSGQDAAQGRDVLGTRGARPHEAVHANRRLKRKVPRYAGEQRVAWAQQASCERLTDPPHHR